MAKKDYSDLDKARPVAAPAQAITPRRVTGLSVAALIVGILCIPASIIPFIGIVAAAIGIIVGMVAVIFMMRNDTQRSFAITGLVLGIVAMAIAIFITHAAQGATKGCENLRGAEFQDCVKHNQQ